MARRWPMLLGALLGLLALVAGLRFGVDRVDGWLLATRWTARVGLPGFLVAYSASSIGRLWHNALTRKIWRNRRWWGLGFAASHTVHLFALWTYVRISGKVPPAYVLLLGGIGYLLLYLMALTSTDEMMRLLGRGWKRLHTLGIHWLWMIFFVSYLARTLKPQTMLLGTIGATLCLAALGLRIAVRLSSRNRRSAAI